MTKQPGYRPANTFIALDVSTFKDTTLNNMTMINGENAMPV